MSPIWILIKNLPAKLVDDDFRKSHLSDFFRDTQFVSVKLPHKGVSWASFELFQEKDAEYAVEAINKKKYDGRRVAATLQKPKITLKGLPLGTTVEELTQFLGNKPVHSVCVDPETGRGEVELLTVDTALDIFNLFNSNTFQGVNVAAEFAD